MRFKEYSISKGHSRVVCNTGAGMFNPIITVDSSGEVKRKGRLRYNYVGYPIPSLQNLRSRSYPDFYVIKTSYEKDPEVKIPCWRTEDGIYINAEFEKMRLKGPPIKPSKRVFNFYLPEEHPLFNFDIFSVSMFYSMGIRDHIEIHEPEVHRRCSVPVVEGIFKEIETNPLI